MATAKLSGQRLTKALKTVRAFVPCYKDAGVNISDFFQDIERKLSHEFGTAIASTGIRCATSPRLEKYASGIVGVVIGRHLDALDCLRYGERRYDLTVKLGEQRLHAIFDGELLSTNDYSHVARDAVLAKLKEFEGLTEQRKMKSLDFIQAIPSREHLIPLPKEVLDTGHQVICHSIELKNFEPPLIGLEILCGANFQPRVFAEDLGLALGTVAHTAKLHRLVHGPFSVDDAMPSYAISWKQLQEVHALHKQAVYEYRRRIRAETKELRPTLKPKAVYR